MIYKTVTEDYWSSKYKTVFFFNAVESRDFMQFSKERVDTNKVIRVLSLFIHFAQLLIVLCCERECEWLFISVTQRRPVQCVPTTQPLTQ